MIEFRGFTKRFGPHPAVEALSLRVGRGEVVALLGPNGSGKTTSLKAGAGLITPTSGDVLIGDPPRSAREAGARELLSFLPQRVSFPEALTGREVVDFYRDLRGGRPERSAEVLKIAALNGSSDRAVSTYSGGMVQRLGLAVALLPNAPLFLLDEPTAALDPAGLIAFYTSVEGARANGGAVLFTSHQMGDAERLADRFAILVEGRLVADLSARELKDRLADRGVMRLRVGSGTGDALEAVKPLSPGASWRAGEMVVPGAGELRPAVLHRLSECGFVVSSLVAEEGRLDSLYAQLTEGEP